MQYFPKNNEKKKQTRPIRSRNIERHNLDEWFPETKERHANNPSQPAKKSPQKTKNNLKLSQEIDSVSPIYSKFVRPNISQQHVEGEVNAT